MANTHAPSVEIHALHKGLYALGACVVIAIGLTVILGGVLLAVASR